MKTSKAISNRHLLELWKTLGRQYRYDAHGTVTARMLDDGEEVDTVNLGMHKGVSGDILFINRVGDQFVLPMDEFTVRYDGPNLDYRLKEYNKLGNVWAKMYTSPKEFTYHTEDGQPVVVQQGDWICSRPAHPEPNNLFIVKRIEFVKSFKLSPKFNQKLPPKPKKQTQKVKK